MSSHEKINQAVLLKDNHELEKLLLDMHEADIAQVWEDLDEESRRVIFYVLDNTKSLDLFEEMEVEQQQDFLSNISLEEAVELLNEMADDDRADLFSELPHEDQQKYLDKMHPVEVQKTRKLLKFREGTAGSLMTTDFLYIYEFFTVKETIEKIRTLRKTVETVYTIYVSDEQKRLIGIVTLTDLVLAAEDVRLSTIMKTKVKSLHVDMDQEECARQFSKYNFISFPVIDDDNVLHGLITVDDILDVMEEERGEDLHLVGGSTALVKDYSQTGVSELFFARFPWLCVLLFMGIVMSKIMGYFEDVLAKMVALSFFIPLLAGTSGNAGSQAATTIVRGIATGDLDLNEIHEIIRKEFSVSFFCAFFLGVLLWLLSYFLTGSMPLAVVVTLSLFLTLIFSTLIGAMLPLGIYAIGMDPAVMAGPILTTIVDIMTLLIYFLIAGKILGL
ncbi:magnesium transporter [Candidatus Riflebacteria bacterium]